MEYLTKANVIQLNCPFPMRKSSIDLKWGPFSKCQEINSGQTATEKGSDSRNVQCFGVTCKTDHEYSLFHCYSNDVFFNSNYDRHYYEYFNTTLTFDKFKFNYFISYKLLKINYNLKLLESPIFIEQSEYVHSTWVNRTVH